MATAYSAEMATKLHPICKTVGTNLRFLRAKAGLTQTQVANMAGVHLRYVQDIEAENRNPTVGVIERMKIGFECGWGDLLDENHPKESARGRRKNKKG